MQQALSQFEANLNYVKSLGGIYRALRAQTTNALDLTDILRAQIVMTVSALDQFIHELACLGMLEIAGGLRLQSAGYGRFDLSLRTVHEWLMTPASPQSFENEIRDQLSIRSFQQPAKIADAVRLFSDVSLWEAVALELAQPAPDAKRGLQVIINRRNQIAHEADLVPLGFGARWPIDQREVDDAVNFVERLANAIFKVTV